MISFPHYCVFAPDTLGCIDLVEYPVWDELTDRIHLAGMMRRSEDGDSIPAALFDEIHLVCQWDPRAARCATRQECYTLILVEPTPKHKIPGGLITNLGRCKVCIGCAPPLPLESGETAPVYKGHARSQKEELPSPGVGDTASSSRQDEQDGPFIGKAGYL